MWSRPRSDADRVEEHDHPRIAAQTEAAATFYTHRLQITLKLIVDGSTQRGVPRRTAMCSTKPVVAVSEVVPLARQTEVERTALATEQGSRTAIRRCIEPVQSHGARTFAAKFLERCGEHNAIERLVGRLVCRPCAARGGDGRWCGGCDDEQRSDGQDDDVRGDTATEASTSVVMFASQAPPPPCVVRTQVCAVGWDGDAIGAPETDAPGGNGSSLTLRCSDLSARHAVCGSFRSFRAPLRTPCSSRRDASDRWPARRFPP